LTYYTLTGADSLQWALGERPTDDFGFQGVLKTSDLASRKAAKFKNRPTFDKIFDPPLDVGLAVF